MEDSELRQAIALVETYRQRVEALTRQVQMLRVSLDEVMITSDTLKAFKDARDGDDIMVPVGASSFITVKVTPNRNVVVGIGSDVSVEKDIDDAIHYMDASNAEISESLKGMVEALNDSQKALSELSAAVQREYGERNAGTGQ